MAKPLAQYLLLNANLFFSTPYHVYKKSATIVKQLYFFVKDMPGKKTNS